MAGEPLHSIKVWGSTLPDIDKLGAKLARARKLPKGMALSKAEVVHYAIQAALAALGPGRAGKGRA